MTRRRSQEELRDSELGWIGEIPFEWKIVPTKQVLKLVRRTVGENWSMHQLLSLTKKGVVKRDIESNQGKLPESFDTYQSVHPGELIFCLFDVDETPRTVGLAEQFGMVTGAYDCFRTLPSLDHRFAYWYFIAIDDGKRYRPLYSGLRKVVPKPRFLSAGFALPPIDEQRQIADYLDAHTAKIDLLIEKQERLIESLAERRVSLLNAAIESIANVRVTPLKYLYRQSRIANSPGSEVLSVYREYGVIPKSSRSGNANKTPEDVSRYLVVAPGDLVVNKMKAWQGSLGISSHAGIVSGDYEVARPISGQLDSRFVHFLLRSHRYISQYRLRSVGIRPSQWRLYWDQLGDIELPIPALAVQEHVVDLVERETAQMDTLSAKAGEMIEVLNERRQALISAATTGKIDVRGLS